MHMKTDKGKKNNTRSSVFDRMIAALTEEAGSVGFLEVIMADQTDIGTINKVPQRYRLIALGFTRGSSLAEVNEMLKSNGCAGLYSRNMLEASLIYAFLKGMSYDGWKDLYRICEEVREEANLKDPYFENSRVGYNDIQRYIEENSDHIHQLEITQHRTGIMDDKLRRLAEGRGDFRDYLLTNIGSFSPVREKTRYYFCKYLYYYLGSCIDRYLASRKDPAAEEAALEEAALFKGLTTLKRKKNLTDEEARAVLAEAGISFGGIFSAFDYYWFGYVSLDWMDVLVEYYGEPETVTGPERAQLAAALRHYEPRTYGKLADGEAIALLQKKLDDAERTQDEEYSRDGSRGYQKNRAGENTIRDYIKGRLDIDRTTLICFLVFFGSKADLPADLEISRKRLDLILKECGFAELRRKDEFDDFIIRFLESDDPVDMLMYEVTDYALEEENFFLYKTYLASRSAEADMRKLFKE